MLSEINGYTKDVLKDGNQFIVFDTDTGEVIGTFDTNGYVNWWLGEWNSNQVFRDHFTKGYRYPSLNPDDSKNMKELLAACSDKTRHRKGDTGYLLDYLMTGKLSKTESKIFIHLSKKLEVWNYCVTTFEEIKSVSELKSDKQVRTVWKSLQTSGLVTLVNTEFQYNKSYCWLVKLHPKLCWEGRYSAWLASLHADYEYEDSVTLD